MATHYTATEQTISLKDYAYGGKDWTNISLKISIAANGTVTYKATSTNNTGGWKYCGLWITVNGNTKGNNYFNTESECNNAFGNKKFPIDDDSTYSGSAGTVSGDSVSYEIKLDCGSDGNVHGWTGSANNNYKGVTKSGTINRNYWTDNTAGGKPTITNGKDGSFSISGKSGTAGTNNSITETKLQYKLDSGSWTTCSANSLSTTELTCDDDVASQTVTARTRYKCALGGNTNSYIYSEEAAATINNYVAPALPTKAPTIEVNKSRFTTRENWNCRWNRSGQTATALNGSSAVQGYRFILKQNGSVVDIKDSNGKVISSTTASTGWKYLDTTSTSITIYPEIQGFVAGETVQIGIKPYSKDGNGKAVFNDNYKQSEIKTVQNAGVVRVKVKTGGTNAKPIYDWKEGVVWVKVNKGTAAKPDIQWVEADTVQAKVKTGGTNANPTYGWKISE